tara:strand:- start:109 stop:414 length:306 start_codon:yes stop_codon:yes gene_type:complete
MTMKKISIKFLALLILLVIFSCKTDQKSEKTIEEVENSVSSSEIIYKADKADNSHDIDCPKCYGTLKRTYKIEYCHGQRCLTRELYRCNFNSDHEYWIYEN